MDILYNQRKQAVVQRANHILKTCSKCFDIVFPLLCILSWLQLAQALVYFHCAQYQ